MVTPRGRNAPNDWPPVPTRSSSMVSSGSPSPPNRRVTAPPSIAPTLRWSLRAATVARTGVPSASAGAASVEQLVVERLLQAVVLRLDPAPGGAFGQVRHVQHGREVEPVGLPVVDRRHQVEQLGAADRLVDGAEAQLGQVAADLLGEELEEGLDELRLAGELLAQLRVLGGDADRAGVEVADPHHHAAGDDQRRGGEAELLGAEQRRDDHVPAGLELAVDLHGDPVAQPVEQQRLLGLGEPQLPRGAGVLERVERAGARTPVMARRSG